MRISLRQYFSFLFLFLFQQLLFSGNTRYRLVYSDDPSTSVVVGWDQTSGNNPVVYYGPVDHGTDWSLYPYQKPVDRNISFRTMNNCYAVLSGLTPGTAYYFVIKDDVGVSRRLWFKTITANSNDTLSIIAGGDSRTDAPAWIPGYGDASCRPNRQFANKMVSKLRPDFVAFSGDFILNLDIIIWSSDADQEWKDWLDDWQLTISSDGRIYPLLIAQGNHETADDVFNLFNTPGSEIYYALNFGGDLLRWYTLNTEVAIPGAQTTWLTADLDANTGKIWRFAQYHNPIRPHVSDKPEGTDSYTYWPSLFRNRQVQLVVEADAHTCKYTWPVIPCSSGTGCSEGFERNDTLGSVYIGEGTWGAPMRDADDNKPWTRASEKTAGFHWLFVSRYKTEIRTIKYGNADIVSSVNDNNRFSLPLNLDIWNPPNGNVIVISNRNISSENEILSFSFTQQTCPATINPATHEIYIEVGYGTGLTSLMPSITISQRAVINPLPGVAQNFTNTFVYRVTAENLSIQDWNIYVTEAYTPSNANDIVSFHLSEEVGTTLIDNINHSVVCNVPLGTNLTSLSPTITVSPFATIMPWSGIPQDFSGTVTYRVTAQSGQAQNWLDQVNETNDTTGVIKDNESRKMISAVYPNPSIGELTIKFSIPTESMTLILSDNKGCLLKKIFLENINSDTYLMDVKDLAENTYYLTIYSGKKVESHKFVLKN